MVSSGLVSSEACLLGLKIVIFPLCISVSEFPLLVRTPVMLDLDSP